MSNKGRLPALGLGKATHLLYFISELNMSRVKKWFEDATKNIIIYVK
jgi:hypothetical protein